MTLYTIGYGNRQLDWLMQALADHPDTILIDARRFPVSPRRPLLSQRGLEQRLGERYRFDGIWLGNGTKQGTLQPHWQIGTLWQANVADWPHPVADTAAMLVALESHLHQLKDDLAAHGAMPMFLCAEADHRRCHRTDVVTLAQRAWPQDEIVHL